MSKFASSNRPGADPATTTYDVIRLFGGSHVNVTVDPVRDYVSRTGGSGGPSHEVRLTTTTISFDAGLRPAALAALTRTTYVPGDTPTAVYERATLPVA